MTNIEENNVINIEDARKALTFGGSGGDENWLAELPPGSVFLSRPNNVGKERLFCDLYCVMEQKKLTTNVIQKMPTGQEIDLWFPTLEFSRNNKLIETIATVEFGYEDPKKEQEETTTEETDGSSTRTIQPS